MSVAVVIALRNGVRWIDATLDCVERQTAPPDELVVVDDGSSDGSRERVAKRPGVTLLSNPQAGSVNARNLGVARTRAPWLAFLDQDDLWHPTHLGRLGRLLQEHPDAPAAAAAQRDFDAHRPPEFGPPKEGWVTLDPWQMYPFSSGVVSPSVVLVRRSALAAVGGWSAAYTGLADFHLWLKLSAAAPLVKSRAKTAARRLHGSSHSFAQRERPLAYLELHARAAADVLRRREQGGELARRRFGQLASARAIVAATLARDPDGLAAPARKLERDTAGESEPYLEVLVGFLVYVLFPAGSLRARRGRGAALAGALHAAWPRDAVRLRRALARAAADGRGLAWSLLPRGPWRRRSPRLLLDARS